MEDRLKELKSDANYKALNTSTSSSGSDFMPEFMKKVKVTQQLLEKIKANNEEMTSLKEQHKTAIQSVQEQSFIIYVYFLMGFFMKEISEGINSIIQENSQLSLKVKELLEVITTEVEKSKKSASDDPETRIKESNQIALTNKFGTILKQSQAIQSEMKTSVKEKVKRQAKQINPDLNDEQLEDVCADPQLAQKLIQEKMFGQGHTKVQNAVSDIQDKFRDIQRLERSVEQVFQMFQDLAVLVKAQGEQIDSIEANVNNAKHYVQEGNQDLEKGKEYQQSARKKMLFLLLCVTCTMAVIIFLFFKFLF